MSIRFSNLWYLWIGWTSADIILWLCGRNSDFVGDSSVACFLVMAWFGQRFLLPFLRGRSA